MLATLLLCLSSKFGLIVVDDHQFKNDAHSVGFLMRSHSVRSDHILTLTFSDVLHPSKLTRERTIEWYRLLEQNMTEKNLLVFVSDGESESAKDSAFRSKFVSILRNITKMRIAPNIFFIVETRNLAKWSGIDLKNCLTLVVVKHGFESESCDPFVRDFFEIGNRFPKRTIRKIVGFMTKRDVEYRIEKYGNEAIMEMRLAEFVGVRSREFVKELKEALAHKKKKKPQPKRK